VLEAALVEPRVDAGRLPVDDVVARRHLARRAAEPRGEGTGDDLDALARDQPVRLRRRRGGIGRVGDREHELLAHDAAALIDQVADDLETQNVPLALEGERSGDRLEDSDLVLARGRLSADRSELSAERNGESDYGQQEDEARHTSLLVRQDVPGRRSGFST